MKKDVLALPDVAEMLTIVSMKLLTFAFLILVASANGQEPTLRERQNASARVAALMYPSITDKSSAIHVRAVQIYAELVKSGSPIVTSPEAPLTITLLAADALGLASVSSAKPKPRRPGTIAGATAAGLSPEVFAPSTPSASDKLDAIRLQLQMQENQRQMDALQQRMKDNRVTR